MNVGKYFTIDWGSVIIIYHWKWYGPNNKGHIHVSGSSRITWYKYVDRRLRSPTYTEEVTMFQDKNREMSRLQQVGKNEGNR